MLFRLTLISLFILCIGHNGTSQQVNVPFQIINSNSGLPTDVIIATLKDDLGFVWFATSNGIVRWDGNMAKVFNHNSADNTSIGGNGFSRNAFLFDTINNEIIFSNENGLTFFDPHKLTATNYNSKELSIEFLSSVHAVYIDRQNTLWLGTNNGIVKFIRSKQSFANFPFTGNYPDGFNSVKKNINRVFDIKQDVANDSILWLATLSGLVKFNKYSKVFTLYYQYDKTNSNALNNFIKLVTCDNGKIYLGTWNADMAVFNTKNNRFEFHIGSYATNPDYYFPGPVWPKIQKSDTEIWVVSLGKISLLNTNTNKISPVLTVNNEKDQPMTPLSVFIDDNQIMWVATEFGAMAYKITNMPIKNYFMPYKGNNYWFHNNTLVENTKRKKLFLGFSHEFGISVFNLEQNKFTTIPYPGLSSTQDNRKILLLNSDTLLILYRDRIEKLIFNNNTYHFVTVVQDMNLDFIDLIKGGNGLFWVTSANAGLQKINIETGEMKSVPLIKNYFTKHKTLPMFKEIVVDANNNIWFYNDESYGYYNPENNKFRYFTDEAKMNLYCFFVDKYDTIWVGTKHNGLGYINIAKPDEGIHFTDNNRKEAVYSIQKDNSGTFYLLTPSGIKRFHRNRKSVVFSKNQGLIKYDKWSNRDPSVRGKLYKLSDGRMVIGYRRGIGFFYPDSLQSENKDFTPYISSIKIFDKDLPTPDGLWNLNNFTLTHNQNYLSFEYSDLAIQNGKKISLYHWLVGIDNDWVKTNHNSVNYSNLPPGSYLFKVKGINNLNNGQEKQKVVAFTIQPPWWNTWWAKVLFTILMLSLIYSIYRFQLTKALEHEEAVRLKELNTLKSRLYANITHEFRTPLTVIKGITGEMTDSMTKEEQVRCADKITMIERNSDKLLHLVKQMLDMSKLEEGKMKLNLIQDDIVSYLQYVLESFQSLAGAKRIKLVFYHETDKVVMDYDQDKIFMIASNLLSNAIKFTPKGGKVIFHIKKVKTTTNGTELVMKVQDSGIGINSKDLPRIFDRFFQIDNSLTRKGEGTGIGLALTKEIVELMNGKIDVNSIAGKQTEFTVTLPVTTNAPLKKAKQIGSRIFENYPANSEDNMITGTADLPLALVVEDNPDVAKYIVSCLAGKYRVKWAPDGKQGVDAAIEIIPDIIISDVMMPEKDGFEVTETLKQDERTSHIPIVLLTARVTDDDRIKGLSHGADAYLTKPFNKQELFVRLEQLIKIRRNLQEKYSKVEIKLAEKKKPAGEEKFLKKAITIIEKNLDNSEFNGALLAAELNLSESQLYRKLKAVSNKSTALFIRGIRLSAAKEMLTITDNNVSQIAYLCGFNNPAWFSSAFKEVYGVSPSDYKR
jgi:signal transduction histidine kinase/DNA-binding response OmpR family regulator/ligand-binding sensor domain-containing protein